MSHMLFLSLVGFFFGCSLVAYGQVPQLQQNVQRQMELQQREATTKQQEAQKLKKGTPSSSEATPPASPGEVLWVSGLLSTTTGAFAYDFKNQRSYALPVLNAADRKQGERQLSANGLAAMRGEWLWTLRFKKQGWQVEGYSGKRYRQGRNFEVGVPQNVVSVSGKIPSPQGFFVLQNDPVVFGFWQSQEWWLYKGEQGRKLEFPKDNPLVKVHANNISNHVVLEFQKNPRYAVISANAPELVWLQDPKQAQTWVQKLSEWQDHPLVRVGKSFYHTPEDPADVEPAFETSLPGDLCMMQSVDGNLLLGNSTQVEVRHYRTFVLIEKVTPPRNFQWCLNREF